MSGADFNNSEWKFCTFDKNFLINTTMRKAEFKTCNFKGLVFDSPIADSSFTSCTFNKSEFVGVTFTNAFFKNCKMRRAGFKNCRADKLTYSFLVACKADTSGIERIE